MASATEEIKVYLILINLDANLNSDLRLVVPVSDSTFLEVFG